MIVRVGSIMEAMIVGLRVEHGSIVLEVTLDGDPGDVYEIRGPLSKGAEPSQERPGASEAPMPARLPAASEAPAGGPSEADLGITDPGFELPLAPRVERSVTPWSQPQIIAERLAANPGDLPAYARQMSLSRRRLVAKGITELLGPDIKNTQLYESLVSIEPRPPGDQNTSMQWGREAGIGMDLFGEKLNTRLAKEARQTVLVDNTLDGAKQTTPKGAALTPTRAAQLMEDWKKQ